MGLLYNFERLIKKYSADCQLLSESSSGSYVGGEWIPDEAPPPQGITGAVIPMMDRKIYQSGGTYTISSAAGQSTRCRKTWIIPIMQAFMPTI